jgi:lactate permease
LNWIAAGGTLPLIAGLITIPVVSISLVARTYVTTLKQLHVGDPHRRDRARTCARDERVGPDDHAGALVAGAGGIFAFIGPMIGWLDVAVTGADVSSNSLFGALQVTGRQAIRAVADPDGGRQHVWRRAGDMISPRNLAIGAAAVGLVGQEGEILRRVVDWSLVRLLAMCVIVYLQSADVLGWMVVD